MPCKIVGGTKVPGNESSSERKVQGMKVPRNFRSSGTKVPENDSARERKFQGTFVPQERKFPGTKSFRNTKVPYRDYSFLGTKGLGHEKSRYPAEWPGRQPMLSHLLSRRCHSVVNTTRQTTPVALCPTVTVLSRRLFV